VSLAWAPEERTGPLWFDEPRASKETAEECRCRLSGDQADASDCPAHGDGRQSAVRLMGGGSEECPF
jgi:hypothetical protein